MPSYIPWELTFPSFFGVVTVMTPTFRAENLHFTWVLRSKGRGWMKLLPSYLWDCNKPWYKGSNVLVQFWKKTAAEQWSFHLGWLGYMEDQRLPRYMGTIISHHKDPHEPTSFPTECPVWILITAHMSWFLHPGSNNSNFTHKITFFSAIYLDSFKVICYLLPW